MAAEMCLKVAELYQFISSLKDRYNSLASIIESAWVALQASDTEKANALSKVSVRRNGELATKRLGSVSRSLISKLKPAACIKVHVHYNERRDTYRNIQFNSQSVPMYICHTVPVPMLLFVHVLVRWHLTIFGKNCTVVIGKKWN